MRYRRLLGNAPVLCMADKEDERVKASDRMSELFNSMMKALYKTEGAQFSVEIMASPKVRRFIEAHAEVLDSSFEKVKMSEQMRRRLHRSDFIFSGLKAFHELNESFPSMLDEYGNRKPFERFLNDVRKIDETYNQNYLRAEYNFVAGSAEMAAKWERFMKDGDRYNLQYRTQKDDKVRPEHAALDGVTLPPSDPFWEEFYPPNGWNCRCNVVQVRKSKYPATPHAEAMRLGDEALQRDSKGIFRFNPGLEQKSVPDYNPYSIRRCRDCDAKKNQFVRYVPDNELCDACRIVRGMLSYYSHVPTTKGVVRIHSKHGKVETKENTRIAVYLANKYGHKIDLLPQENRYPDADSYNATLGYKQEYKVNYISTRGSIDNLLRSGKRQANHIVLAVDSGLSLGILKEAIVDRIRRATNVESLMLIINNSDVTYTRAQILSDNFKIRREDFK